MLVLGTWSGRTWTSGTARDGLAGRRPTLAGVRVAVCQMSSGEDVETNLGTGEKLLREAAAGDADLAVLPEYFTCLGSSAALAEASETVPGGAGCEMLAAVARDSEM